MRKMILLAAMVALAALMLAATPALAQGNRNNDRNDRNDRFFFNDRNDRNDRFFDDDVRFVVLDDDDFFDDDFFDRNDFFDDDFDQEAESGDVDQTFVVTNTGDNSNQCAGIQGVANTGNAQNQLGVNQLDNGFLRDFNRDRFMDDDDLFDRNDFFLRDFDFDGVADDFEFDDVGSTIEVSPTNVTTCDQQVNQAASASG